MGIGLSKTELGSDERLLDYQSEIEYEIAVTKSARERVFHLRHEAYAREGVITPRADARFHDYYDALENCWIFAIYHDERLVSSIRVHVIRPQYRKGPGLDVFPDIIHPLLDAGNVLVDPTRFVTAQKAMLQIPDLAYITMRVPCMACEVFDADYCLVTVREEHIRFYRRVFNATLLCDPRPYPELKYAIAAMRIDVSRMREELRKRHPAFTAGIPDWSRLFSNAGMEETNVERFPAMG